MHLGGTIGIMVIVEKIDTMTIDQILVEAVCISHNLGKV